MSPASSNHESSGSVTLLFHELCAGRAEAMQPLWDHYFPRLMRVAGRTLGDGPQRVAGADDAVQSAFLSFWQQAEAGAMEGCFHRDNLWAFLSVLTVRKARKQIRRKRTVKRGGKLTRVELDVAWEVDPSAAKEAFRTLTPQEFDLYSEELLLQLDESLRPFAVLKLMGYTDVEIADRQGCAERTVQRKMRLTRLAWEAAID